MGWPIGQQTLSTPIYKIVNEMPQAATARNAALPAAVDVVLAKALAKSQIERYPTCSAFVEALSARRINTWSRTKRPCKTIRRRSVWHRRVHSRTRAAGYAWCACTATTML
jgi:serine/threonine-protein kinase